MAKTTAAEREDLFKRSLSIFAGQEEGARNYIALIRSALPLAEKDEHAKALLLNHQGIEWTYLHQMVAEPMLRLHLESSRPNQEAVEFYTRYLIAAESPDADLISQALPVLATRMTVNERQQAVATTQAAAAAWLQKTCETCAAGQTLQASDEVNLTDQQRAIQDGMRALGGMAIK